MNTNTDTTATTTQEFTVTKGVCPVSGRELGKKTSVFAPGMDARLKSLAIKAELSGEVWGVTLEAGREVMSPIDAVRVLGSDRLALQVAEAVRAGLAKATAQVERATRLANEKAEKEQAKAEAKAAREAEKQAKAEAAAAAKAEAEAAKAAAAEATPESTEDKPKRSRKAKVTEENAA